MRRLLLPALLLPLCGPTFAEAARNTDAAAAAPVAVPALVPATASSTGQRSSANTYLLCAPAGETYRATKRKPSSCNTLGPEDSFAEAMNLAKLKWSGWGNATATATGIEKGFHSPASKTKVRVTVSRPRANDCGGYTYTRIKATSRYGTTTQSLPANCGS